MKSIDKLFIFDSEQKEFLQKISSLCGIKQDIIKQVWQFTLFSILIDLLENKDKNINIFELPFVGKVLLKPRDDKSGDLEQFFILNSHFKEIIKSIKAGNETDLIGFFQENFINKVLDSIVNE